MKREVLPILVASAALWGAANVYALPGSRSSIVWREKIEGVTIAARTQPTANQNCRIALSGIKGTIQHFALSDPGRIVIDISNLKLSFPEKKLESPQTLGCVRSVRLGRHPEFTRMVFDLRDFVTSDYHLAQQSSIVVLTIGENPEIAEKVAAIENVDTEPTTIPTSAETIEPAATPSTEQSPEPEPELEVAPTLGEVSASTQLPTQSQMPEPTATLNVQSEPLQPEPIAIIELPTAIPTATATPEPTAPVVLETLPAPVEAKLRFKVDQIFVELPTTPTSSKNPLSNITVTNISDEPLNMTARAVLLNDPGSEQETEEKTNALLVSPSMFTIEPGEQRRVRLVGMTDPAPEREEIFRVHLVPLTADFDQLIQLKMAGVAAQINVISALAITVVRPPATPTGEIAVKRSKNLITLVNEANHSISIVEPKICANTGGACRVLPNRRLHPGASVTLALPATSVLRALSDINGDFEAFTVEGEMK